MHRQVALGWVEYDGTSTTGAPSAPPLNQLVELKPTVPDPGDPDELPDEASYRGPTYDPATEKFEPGSPPTAWRTGHSITPGHRVKHGLIGGSRGTGKTNMLRVVLVEAVSSGRFVVLLADPLDRPQRPRRHLRANRRAVRPQLRETLDLLEAAVRLIAVREGEGYAEPTSDKPDVLVAIDDADAVQRNKHAAQLVAHGSLGSLRSGGAGHGVGAHG
jgi:hypothetical protein